MKDDLVHEIHEKSGMQMIFVGGNGLKIAFRLLARKILEQMKGEERQNCVLPSTPE
ncbi:MAG: hypothetical protein PHH05_05960 [Syntrophaceticus sp.]|nr:hypothetical protein [Syntrophaceticus sp.]